MTPRHRFDDTSQPAILHHYLLRLMLTRYFLFVSPETEMVTVERCYTTSGTSGKSCAEFMPVWSEKSSQNTQSPLVLGGRIHPAPAAFSDSQWRPFLRSTGEPPHHEVQHKSLRRGGRSQAAGISQSQSASLLSSNVCALRETVSETSCPRMTSMPPKRQIPATALIFLESHGASRICWMNGAGFPVADQHSPQLTSEFRGVWAKWKSGWMSTARPPLDKKSPCRRHGEIF